MSSLRAVLLRTLLAGVLVPVAAAAEPPAPHPRHPAVVGAAHGLARSDLIGTRVADPDPATARWGWPLVGRPRVVRGFQPPAQRWSAGHRGIDLAGIGGEQVLAVDAGVVSFAGTVAGVGMLSITHASGVRSTYQPVLDRVPAGTRVGRGDRVGVLGPGGHCPPGECLHLGAVRGRDGYLDPTPLLLGLEPALVPVPTP